MPLRRVTLTKRIKSRWPRSTSLDFEALIRTESLAAGSVVTPCQRSLPSSGLSAPPGASQTTVPGSPETGAHGVLTNEPLTTQARTLARTMHLQRIRNQGPSRLVSEAANLHELLSLLETCSGEPRAHVRNAWYVELRRVLSTSCLDRNPRHSGPDRALGTQSSKEPSLP